jgi:hypothetical protein
VSDFAPAQKPAGPLGGYTAFGGPVSDGDTSTGNNYSPGDNSGKEYTVSLGEQVTADGLRYHATRSDSNIRLGSTSFESYYLGVHPTVGASLNDSGWTEVAPADYSYVYGAFDGLTFDVQTVGTVRIAVSDTDGDGTADTLTLNEIQPHVVTMPRHDHK